MGGRDAIDPLCVGSIPAGGFDALSHGSNPWAAHTATRELASSLGRFNYAVPAATQVDTACSREHRSPAHSAAFALKLVERSFRLEAPSGLGRAPRPDLIGPLFTHLPDTLQDAVRMGFLHSSRARGRVPNALKAASEVRFRGHEADGDGATILHFQVPRFADAAPNIFGQTLLWDDGPQPEQTAFELLGAALRDVEDRRADSSRFDRGLLRRIRNYSRVLNRGLDHISLPDAMLPKTPQINPSVVQAATELSAATPRPQRIRIAGRLDVMGASEAVLKLEVKTGVVVTALWEGTRPIDELREFFNRDVVLEGQGVFRPSGTLLRIDTDAVALASRQDDFFRHVPEAQVETDLAKAARLRPSEKSIYTQILGRIPAEETDEEFAAAVEEMS